jgi:hypothetical protein
MNWSQTVVGYRPCRLLRKPLWIHTGLEAIHTGPVGAMKRSRMLYVIAGVGCLVAGDGQRKESSLPNGYPYSAAFISTINATPRQTELVVFPFQGAAFRIPLRSISVPRIFSPDGKALYGPCTPLQEDVVSSDGPIKIASCKIDLKTGSTTLVPGTVHDFVPHHEDGVPSTGHARLFGLSLSDGKPREITLPADPHPWMDVSLCPDNERAVATHNGRVELIDIVHGTVEPLGDELFMAAWSPDGKWLAAVEKGEHGRTILMEAKSLARRRILGPSELAWSPDSHYLLGMKQHGRCGPYYGTLEAIDVETGGRTTIKSSECQVNQTTTGWVSSEILTQPGQSK